MRITLAALAIAAAALTLTACGGTSAPAGGASPAAPTVAQVAARIGATDVTAITPTLYATHEGDATWHGQQVDIATFATDHLRDQWEAVAKGFGPILEDGHDWAMTTG